LVIGKGGATVKEICRLTTARVTVPGKDRPPTHTVRVEAEDIADLLHVCWELVTLGIGRSEPVGCTVSIANGSSFALDLQEPSAGSAEAFLTGGSLSAYGLTTRCTHDELDALVDNERFAHPEVSASCHIKDPDDEGGTKKKEHRRLVLICGEASENPRRLRDSLARATVAGGSPGPHPTSPSEHAGAEEDSSEELCMDPDDDFLRLMEEADQARIRGACPPRKPFFSFGPCFLAQISGKTPR